MGDAEAKRALLADWWRDLMPRYSVSILRQGAALTKADVSQQLKRLLAGRTFGLSVYVLFAQAGDQVLPMYIGKAESPLRRWEQHADGWCRGVHSYAQWRAVLLDSDGLARQDLVLLVVPESAIGRPPIPGFPTTVGAVEYQLVGLVEDAFPGCLLNHEGKAR